MYRPSLGAPALEAAGTMRRPDLDVTVPALARHLPLLRETARSFARTRGVPRPDDVRLAISEACTNVVLHAYPGEEPGPLHLRGTAEPGRVTFTVEDRGAGMRPTPLRGGLGIGLAVIARVADHFSVTDHAGGGTRVQMTFATGSAAVA